MAATARLSAAVVLALAFLAFAGVAWAQGAVGGLRGQVVDADFSAPIPNATVILGDSGRTASTDEAGNYFFNDVSPGSYAVSASREGYRRSESRQVAVNAGAVAEVNVQMEGEVVELDDFVVSSEDLVSSEPTRLLDIRADLNSFADVLGADFIAKVGGSDVGDVVKRIVGTSVADSRYVVIRGLSDRYTSVTLNGARIPSSDPDKRAVNIDIFPSNLVGQISNTKTFTPDISGEATGGAINIVTKGSPNKPFVSLSFGLGYNTQSTGNGNFITYQGAGTGLLGTQNDRRIPSQLKAFTRNTLPLQTGNSSLPPEQVLANKALASRLLDPTTGVTTQKAPLDTSFSASAGTIIPEFLGGPLGLLAAFTYNKKFDFDPSVVRAQTLLSGPPGFVNDFTKFYFEGSESSETLLVGLLVAAGWDPTPTDKIKLTFFANVAAEDRAFFQKGLIRDSTSGEVDRATLDSSRSVAIREGLQYVERRLRTLQLTGQHDFPAAQNASVHWGMAYSLSSQAEPDGRFSSALFDRTLQSFTQLPEFRGPPSQRYWRQLDDTNYNILGELKIPLFQDDAGSQKALIRLGGNFDYSTRDFRADTFSYNNAFLGGGLPGVETPSNRTGFTAADVTGRLGSLGRLIDFETYEASQVIAAGYFIAEANITSKFRVSAGLRAEVTDIRVYRDPADFFDPVSGSLLGPPAAPGPTTEPFTGVRIPDDQLGQANIEQVDVLPAVSMSWDFVTNMKLRFAASRTIARPSFKELAQVYLTDPISTAQFRGNSSLRTSTIDNVDLRWEWFPSPGDVIAISGFTKFIQDPIELFTSPSFDFFANQESAVIYGYEFEVQKNLGFLAEELRNFAIGFNGTKLYSSVELIDVARNDRIRAELDPVRRLQGQPDYLLNFNLTYDNKESGFFAGIFLNVTGETLYQAGSQDAESGFAADVFQQPFTSLDFTLSQKVGENFKVTFRAENLVNAKVERFGEGNVDYAKSSGTKYSLSITGTW